MGLDSLAWVRSYNSGQNRVESEGILKPSSESLSHGALYDLGPHIRFVIHAHSPEIWSQGRQLQLPSTDPKIPYGSSEIDPEIRRLARQSALMQRQLLLMGGHQDGVISFGRSAEEAAQILLAALAQAYQLQYGRDALLCRAG